MFPLGWIVLWSIQFWEQRPGALNGAFFRREQDQREVAQSDRWNPGRLEISFLPSLEFRLGKEC